MLYDLCRHDDFDCAHAGEVPMMDELTLVAPSMSRGVYRDIEYLRKECQYLSTAGDMMNGS